MTPFPLPVQTNITWTRLGQTSHKEISAYGLQSCHIDMTSHDEEDISCVSICLKSSINTGMNAHWRVCVNSLLLFSFIKTTTHSYDFVCVCVCVHFRRCQMCDQQCKASKSLNEKELARKLIALSKWQTDRLPSV